MYRVYGLREQDDLIQCHILYVGKKSLLDMLQASTENINKISWLVIRFKLCYFSVEAFFVNTCKCMKLFGRNNQGRVRSETNVLGTSLSSLGSVQGKTIRCWFSVSESINRMLLPNFCSGQLEGGIRLSGCTMLLDLESPYLSICVCCCSTWQSKSLYFSLRAVKIWKIMRPPGPEM